MDSATYMQIILEGDSLVAQMVKHLPTMWETGFDPWVGKILWRRNGNPLQYSCQENPMDGGVW